MNREDIIRMATKAGWQMPVEWDGTDGFSRRLERFAARVAAAEREACAKVCERFWSAASLESDRTATAIAAAIRKRGEVKP